MSVAGVEVDDGGGEPRIRQPDPDDRLVHARNDVRVRHHEIGRDGEAGAGHRRTALGGLPRHLHDGLTGLVDLERDR